MIFNASVAFSPFNGKNRVKAATKMLRVMKLTALLLFIASLHVSANGLAQDRVTFSGKEVSLEKVFSAIKKQTSYTFLYREDVIQNGQKVNINVKNATVEEVMELCIRNQPFSYLIKGKSIFIINREEAPKPKPQVTSLLNNLIDVKGRVIDENGVPIVGANVTIKGTNQGTATDDNGYFSLPAIDENAVILVSNVGYETRELHINGKVALTVSLKVAINNLDETVVIAYGSSSRRFLTGSISKIKGEDILKQPVSDPIIALQGRVPGLYIAQTSGIPGAYSTIRLRGQNSIANGNDPFYIIDGVPFTSTSLTSRYFGGGAVGNPTNDTREGLSPFNNLNPADIESIEVLKDADATAIYGSRGANGVVLITTKKGKAGKTKFDINVCTGSGNIKRRLNFLNTQQYLELRHEAFNNDNKIPRATDYDINGKWDTTRYTDWQKIFIGGTSHFTNAQGSLSGGTVNTQFVIGGGYNKQTTVYPGDFSDAKGSFHINVTHASLNQKFHAYFSANYVNDKNNIPTTEFTNFITLAPDAPPIYDSMGNLNYQYLPNSSTFTFSNPLRFTLQHAKSTTDNLTSNLNVGYTIFPGFQIKSSFGYTHIQMNQSITVPLSSFPPTLSSLTTLRSNSFGNNDIKTWIIEPQMDYSRKIAQGKLELLIGSTFQQNMQTSLSQFASDFSSDALINNISAASSIKVVGSNIVQYHYNAIFGRIHYDWKDKYLVNITARRDGSSRFGPGKQFGNFGAVGLGWIFSNEKLIQQSIPFLSFGKLKFSYGSTGNDQISDYQYLSTYVPYTYPYQSLTGLYPNKIANPYFGWELVKKFEIGLEAGVLNDRILLNTSYYRNRTNNQLVGYTLPSFTGFTSIQANLPAVVENTGLEFELNTINLKGRKFSWSSSFNLSFPKNKLVSFPNIETSTYKNTYAVGKSLFVKKLLHYTGVDPQTGLHTFEDLNKDGVINSQDYQFIAEIKQTYFGGFQNTISYKGFQLDIFFQFVKQTGYNYQKLFSIPGFNNQNLPTYFLSRWRQNGDITDIQKVSQNGNPTTKTAFSNYSGASDGVITDASFVRLKNLFISYSLPSTWLQKAHLQSTRIYLQGQNLITISSYKGLDPETRGWSLPPLKMITAGVQFAF